MPEVKLRLTSPAQNEDILEKGRRTYAGRRDSLEKENGTPYVRRGLIPRIAVIRRNQVKKGICGP